MSYAKFRREHQHNLLMCFSQILKSDTGSDMAYSQSVLDDTSTARPQPTGIRKVRPAKAQKTKSSPSKSRSPRKRPPTREKAVESIVRKMSTAEIDETFRRHIAAKRKQDEFEAHHIKRTIWSYFKLWYQSTLVSLLHSRQPRPRFTLHTIPLFETNPDDAPSTELDFSLSDIQSPVKPSEEEDTNSSIIKDNTQDLDSSSPVPSEIPSPTPSPGLRKHALRRREPELKTYMRTLLPEPLFNEFQQLQRIGRPVPPIEIPKNVLPPWRITPDACPLVADVMTELARDTDLSSHTYESFLQFTHEYFENAQNNKKTAQGILEDLQKTFTCMSASRRTNICDDTVDMIMQSSLATAGLSRGPISHTKGDPTRRRS